MGEKEKLKTYKQIKKEKAILQQNNNLNLNYECFFVLINSHTGKTDNAIITPSKRGNVR